MKKNNKFTLGAVLSGKENSVHHRKSKMTVSGSKFAFGVVKLPFVPSGWPKRAGESGGWFAGFFGNLYGMQGCNLTNLLFLCDVTEPKTGQTHFHPLYSPTNRYIKIYNKFNKFINLFNKFS